MKTRIGVSECRGIGETNIRRRSVPFCIGLKKKQGGTLRLQSPFADTPTLRQIVVALRALKLWFLFSTLVKTTVSVVGRGQENGGRRFDTARLDPDRAR
jgi:hypothetical protein